MMSFIDLVKEKVENITNYLPLPGISVRIQSGINRIELLLGHLPLENEKYLIENFIKSINLNYNKPLLLPKNYYGIYSTRKSKFALSLINPLSYSDLRGQILNLILILILTLLLLSYSHG